MCTRYGIVYIADEVMVGFGRTGHWFACQAWGVEPDLITFAKGVNSGYVPLGGVIISEEIAQRYDHLPYPGGLTYSGHVLACAAGIASIEVFERDDILGHVRAVGENVLGPGLTKLGEKHPSVGEVRGMGYFWAVELVKNPSTREPLIPFNASGADAAPMADVVAAAKSRGLWPFAAGNRLQIAPPLITTEEDIRRGLDILDEVLDIADAYVDV